MRTILMTKWRWAKANPLFWLSVALAAVTFMLVILWRGPDTPSGPSDLRVRLWGTALQLLGVATVWYDLTGATAAFERPGLIRATLRWLASAFRPTSVVTSDAVFSAGRVMTQAHTRAIHKPQTASVEDRLDALEKNVDAAAATADSYYKDLDERARKLVLQLVAERAQREREINTLRQRVEKVVVANAHALEFGAAWLAVGIVVATLAPELAKIAAGQWATVWAAL